MFFRQNAKVFLNGAVDGITGSYILRTDISVMERANMELLLRQQPISMLIVDDSEDDAFLLFSELASRGAKVDYKRVDTAHQ